MKSVHRPMTLVCLFVAICCMFSALTGCTKRLDEGQTPANVSTTGTTIVTEPQRGEKLTLLKEMKITNGDTKYSYVYDYDFDEKLLTVTAKGVPAGDRVPQDCFTWLLTPGILAGENVEAIPDVSGANEELTLWAQPLLASSRILKFRLDLYEEDRKTPTVIRYTFEKNTKGLPSTCIVHYQDAVNDDYDWNAVIKYRYNDDGYLSRVSEVSEDREYVWEYHRDDNNVLTSSTMQVLEKNTEAIDSWVSQTSYVYDDEGKLMAMKVKGEENEDGEEVKPYTTKYLFSETTGNLSMLEDDFTRTTFSYDDSLKKLTQIKTIDNDGGSTYYEMDFTYTEVEVSN